MTRTYDPSVNSYLSEPVIEQRLLADITFANTTMRLHTGVGSLMVGATHYDGIGTLGGVERVTESAETYTPSVKMWLSAVDSVPLSDTISESLFGKTVILKRCWLRAGTVVNTPETSYIGKFGTVEVVRGDPERGNFIEATLHTKLDRKKGPSYFTKEDLALTYSGDTFFDYLPQIMGQKAQWGQKATYFTMPAAANLLGGYNINPYGGGGGK